MAKRVTKKITRKKTKSRAKAKVQKPRSLVISGKRKTAIAKATIKPGSGVIRVNKKPLETYGWVHRLLLLEPLRIAEQILKEKAKEVDIDVKVAGGGAESQVEAARLAIARALFAFTQNHDLRKAYLDYDRSLLVADIRRKEQRKPGYSKARAKRQKSYR